MWRTASIIVGVVLILSTLGIVMLASTSGIQGQVRFDDSLFYVKRQALWLFLAVCTGIVTARLDYRAWQKLAIPFSVLVALLLVLVLLPSIGTTVKGSSRWLRYGGIGIQPSEFAKIAMIVMLSAYMARHQRRATEFIKGFLVPAGLLGVMVLLIFVEPDYGTTALIAVVGYFILFIGGTRFSYLLVSGTMGAMLFVFAIMQNPERLRRIIAFMNPEKYADNEAFQLLNAIYAFVVGGGRGVGLGQSLQKHFYLPEAHTDFIFAILGEELGLRGSLLVVVLFAALFICGVRICLTAEEPFGRLLSFGLTVMITLQAAINIGVVTGSLPTKGLALPFISFGGTSLVASYAMVGILINISLSDPAGDYGD